MTKYDNDHEEIEFLEAERDYERQVAFSKQWNKPFSGVRNERSERALERLDFNINPNPLD